MDALPIAKASASEKFPAEIWLEIFEQVPKSSDLHSLSVVCRKFAQLTTRALHRDLIWTNAKCVAQNLAVWDDSPNAGMETLVRSLVLGVGRLPQGIPCRVVDIHGSMHYEGNYIKYQRNLSNSPLAAVRHGFNNCERSYASSKLNAKMWMRVTTFTNIASLALTNLYVFEAHFMLIHRLPQLRSLHLESCMVHADAARGYNHSTLPITELTMLDVRCGAGRNHHDIVHLPNIPANLQINNVQQLQQLLAGNQLNAHLHPPDPIAQVLSLAIAHNLQKLTVDSSADVFRFVFDAPGAQQRGWTIPATLEHVYIVRKRTCAGADPKPTQYQGEGAFPDSHLYHFCINAQNLRTVSTPIFVSMNVAISPDAMPMGLERFAAPLETAQLIAGARDLKALGMLKCGVGAREGVIALTDIATVRPGLKMLMMECKGWDGEIISCIAENFKELRRLKIVYEGVGPDEDDLVAIAPDYLLELPELHTLELYKLPANGGFKPSYPRSFFDSSFASIEEELQDILIPWNRHCPRLRKVQLLAGYVMTRAFGGAPWKLSRMTNLDEMEDLDY